MKGINMSELTIVIDYWSHKELKDYLMNLSGILEIIIKNEEQLKIYIKYNPDLINSIMIKNEILLFLNIKVPSLISFDKHTNTRTNNYRIVRNNICCEYCLKAAIADLFEINGIEKVESIFNNIDDVQKEVIIYIKYDSNLLSIDDMKQIELKLDI